MIATAPTPYTPKNQLNAQLQGSSTDLHLPHDAHVQGISSNQHYKTRSRHTGGSIPHQHRSKASAKPHNSCIPRLLQKPLTPANAYRQPKLQQRSTSSQTSSPTTPPKIKTSQNSHRVPKLRAPRTRTITPPYPILSSPSYNALNTNITSSTSPLAPEST